MTDLPKTFDPAAIESRWYAHWEGQGLFRPDRPAAEPWTIVIPPPNVTGSLHIGHALDNTLQDILTRHARLKGKDALWVVGTDHAGIATQMVVERQMALHQQKRTDFTRDEFVAKVWEWKAESGGAITRQLRRLGASCDWANERFTMDPGFSKAVIKVFVDLYNEGLLYRDKRLVNWDPGLKTAISDLEVDTREVQGKFWHFRYPLADGGGHISVATTRPETMLADMAVAVNPEDARYTALIGKNVRLPITGRLVPIIADEHADPELGSGAVKITPGHDFNDFEVGIRAGFKPADMLNMLDAEARLVQTSDGLIPQELLGLDRFDARKRVIDLIDAAGLLESVEDRTIATPYGDRSNAVIEPWLTDQWYVDAKTLAAPAIEAVRSGAIKVVPKTWEKTYFNWMENIQPWCVSRQLWWGHRIPAWAAMEYKRRDDDRIDATTKHVYVAETQEQAVEQAAAHSGGRPVIVFDTFDEGLEAFNDGEPSIFSDDHYVLIRDPDVLDTWFSSALWPFGTLGWPEGTEQSPFVPSEVEGRGTWKERVSTSLDTIGEGGSPSLLARHYPNDVLISGFDILFFWDARMIMQGLHFMQEAPFKTLYLHGLVRDATGAKMSKSKGNTVDPLGLIDKYGADALRFTMAAMESQGRDIKLDEKRVEGYRNFATKLWNAARFAQSNGIGASTSLEAPAAELPVNRWIVAETIQTIQKLDLAIADLRFDEAANTIYHFTWSRFCDWYLELIKTVLAPLPLAGGAGGGPEPANSEHGPLPTPNPSPEAEGLKAAETRAVAAWVLDQILVMLHPFMPFITEELWHAMGERPYPLIVAKWPIADARAIDSEASREIDWLIRFVSEVRTARTELNVPPGARTDLMVLSTVHAAFSPTSPPAIPRELIARIDRQRSALHRLTRINHAIFLNTGTEIELATGERLDRTRSSGAQTSMGPQIVVDDVTYIIPVEGVIDLAAERARLGKAIEAAAKERDSLVKRLENPAFVEKAKPEAVAKAREDHAEKSAEADRLSAALARLG